jgi:hypothetical protein
VGLDSAFRPGARCNGGAVVDYLAEPVIRR